MRNYLLLIVCFTFFAPSLSAADKAPADLATPVKKIKLLPGFQAELLYSVPKKQGSWVAMTVDPKGRLITSDQTGKLYRITLAAAGGQSKVEPIDLNIGMAHGLLYAFDSLYVMQNGGKIPGLYRVTDTNGDDKFDTVKLLREINGRGEHGPHAIRLSPDKKSLYVCAGNMTRLPKIEKSRVPRNWQEDHLLPRMWDARGHASGLLAPGGWISRIDPDGKTMELFCTGFRNEFDIAFNLAGELFTYDADMEWDIGSPWYRPTRVNHATSGAEFGWRSGTGKWPGYYPDSLPAVLNVGPGSPTGIVFGTGANFPAKYQQALFIADWSYGKIYAVHMQPKGASYTATHEQFLAAAPLPVTDMIVNPHDGSLYFLIGGRGTQSGLYRVSYTGKESTAPVKVKADAGSPLRLLRRKLGALHHPGNPQAVATAWPYLKHADRHIRFAARIAIEHQPFASWQARALSEKHPVAATQALIALARNGEASQQKAMVESLARIKWSQLNTGQQLDLLRAFGLTFTRLGKPDEDARKLTLSALDSHYPAEDPMLNHELSQLLIYLEAPKVVERTLALLKAASTQEEQIHYMLSLRTLKSGWTKDQREVYFQWFLDSTSGRGGMSFQGFLKNIRQEAIDSLSEKEKLALKPILSRQPKLKSPDLDTTNRKFVKNWTVQELLPVLADHSKGRNFRRGRTMFAAASCFKCHRVAGEGGIVGPDLTAVGRRFDDKVLLQSLIEPSKVISDQYETTTFFLNDGRTVSGRIVNLNKNRFNVLTNMLDPSSLTSISRENVEETALSRTSMMPAGLLDTLSKEELLDLIAYLRSGGNAKHEAFQK